MFSSVCAMVPASTALTFGLSTRGRGSCIGNLVATNALAFRNGAIGFATPMSTTGIGRLGVSLCSNAMTGSGFCEASA